MATENVSERPKDRHVLQSPLGAPALLDATIRSMMPATALEDLLVGRRGRPVTVARLVATTDVDAEGIDARWQLRLQNKG